ncbi:MAG TPA: hypothetical protein VJ801_16545 [Polyangia bacterium]|jgi:hypothetical protein|nr:hypothetical protein [Polyangia bacterium]
MSNHENNIFPRRGEACLSDFMLDRFRLGELQGAPEGEGAGVHVQACERCRGRLSELDAVVAPVIDFAAPIATGSQAGSGRPVARRRGRLWWLVGLPACAAAALVLLIGSGRGPGERSKGGGWQLGVIAQYPSGRTSGISPGAALAPGDHLRFEVSAPHDAFVSVISLDATGAVTPFAPAAGEAAPVRAGARRLLAGAVRLDDSLGPERLMLVACPHTMAVSEVVAAARGALGRAQGKIDKVGDLGLPCPQASFWIRKEARP